MFKLDERGSVAAILGIALPVMLLGIGGVIETSRAVTYRQQLTSAVELACRQAQAFVNGRKPQDVKPGDTAKTYPVDIQRIAQQNFAAKGLQQVPVSTGTTDTNVHVEVAASMPLLMGGVLGRDAIAFALNRDCAVIPTATAITTGPNAPKLLISESFERPSHTVNYNDWSVLGTPSQSSTWNGWTTMNAGIEINGQRELASNTIRFGDFFAELDSDCSTDPQNRSTATCRSNSTMSRVLDLAVGDYEIRYWYIARLRDAGQPGKVICGAKDSDVSWYKANGQTNRIEVYVEKAGNYTFAPANMVDVCVQADAWTERVIRFSVEAKSEYRISWRAAGREDTYGGLIDNLRICRSTCPQ
ncbi:TadE/TadG family type IV pilus assembly protein [Methylobacterium sp. A54F]